MTNYKMTTSSVEIRPLTPGIIKENIAALVEMSGQIRNDYWGMEHYLADLDKKWELSSVAFLNGEICGFIIVSAKPESLHVNRIVVSSKFLRTGIGRLFIEKAIKDTKKENKPCLTLKVDAANESVIAFYKNLNFEVVGRQDDLLLMSLKVTA